MVMVKKEFPLWFVALFVVLCAGQEIKEVVTGRRHGDKLFKYKFVEGNRFSKRVGILHITDEWEADKWSW